MNVIDTRSDTGLLLIIAVAIGVAIAVWLRNSPQAFRAFAKMAVALAAVIVVMVVAAGFFWSTPRLQPAPLKPRQAERISAVNEPSRVTSGVAESPTLVAEAEEFANQKSELPEWTRQLSQVEGASTFVVVKSGLFATIDEAELHAFDEAGHAAAKHFRHLDPSGVGRCVPTQRELVRESAIRIRFDEISPADLGTLKNFPMHQVWLRVELSPQLGERFAEPWRQAVIEARLRTLAGWGIWSTVAAALIAFALRIDSAWNGRRRTFVVGATVALMLGSLVFLA